MSKAELGNVFPRSTRFRPDFLTQKLKNYQRGEEIEENPTSIYLTVGHLKDIYASILSVVGVDLCCPYIKREKQAIDRQEIGERVLHLANILFNVLSDQVKVSDLIEEDQKNTLGFVSRDKRNSRILQPLINTLSRVSLEDSLNDLDKLERRFKEAWRVFYKHPQISDPVRGFGIDEAKIEQMAFGLAELHAFETYSQKIHPQEFINQILARYYEVKVAIRFGSLKLSSHYDVVSVLQGEEGVLICANNIKGGKKPDKNKPSYNVYDYISELQGELSLLILYILANSNFFQENKIVFPEKGDDIITMPSRRYLLGNPRFKPCLSHVYFSGSKRKGWIKEQVPISVDNLGSVLEELDLLRLIASLFREDLMNYTRRNKPLNIPNIQKPLALVFEDESASNELNEREPSF